MPYTHIPCPLRVKVWRKLNIIYSHVLISLLCIDVCLCCAVVLASPIELSLDDCVEYIQEDELVEVTPVSIRIAKNPKMQKKGRA